MRFVATLSWKPHLTRQDRDEVLMRRTEWDHPDSVEVLGEWWPASSSTAVVVAFETDDYEEIMEIDLTWGDAFEIEMSPAVTPDEGLELGPRILERRV